MIRDIHVASQRRAQEQRVAKVRDDDGHTPLGRVQLRFLG